MIAPIRRFSVTVVEEMKKVVWPTRNQAIRLSLIVIASVAVSTLAFALIDTGFRQVVSFLIER